MTAKIETPDVLPLALDRESLRDVIDLALWAGQLLLQSGAQSVRVERTVRLLGTALGADNLDVVVLPEGLMVTTASGDEFRTRIRRVAHLGVNMAVIAAINDLSRRVSAGQIDLAGVRGELMHIAGSTHHYNRWVVMIMVGFACAAFSRLFGGDWITFGVTLVAASTAMFVRQTLVRQMFNPLLVIIVTAFVAGVIPGMSALIGVLPRPETALAASVLLLVPGVPLINAARDILRGYVVMGSGRGIIGFVISLCIALGLMVALQITGVRSLDSGPRASVEPVYLLAADALWSGVAALGFAVLFNVPRRFLPYCAITGAAGHALRALLMLTGLSLTSATLFGAIMVGFLGELFARRLRSPAGLFSVAGAIPMVPGVFAFRAMIGIINLGVLPTGAQASEGMTVLIAAVINFAVTGLVLAALAVGIALPSLLMRRE